jgi:hypothetical protein
MGADRQPQLQRAVQSVFVITGVMLMTFMTFKFVHPKPPAPPSVAIANVDRSPTMHAERGAFIQKMINQGLFMKVSSHGVTPEVWVTRQFISGKFEDQETLISIVYAYNFDGRNPADSIAVVEASTGRQIASYDSYGLHMK